MPPASMCNKKRISTATEKRYGHTLWVRYEAPRNDTVKFVLVNDLAIDSLFLLSWKGVPRFRQPVTTKKKEIHFVNGRLLASVWVRPKLLGENHRSDVLFGGDEVTAEKNPKRKSGLQIMLKTPARAISLLRVCTSAKLAPIAAVPATKTSAKHNQLNQ